MWINTIICKSGCLLLESLTTFPNSVHHEQSKIWINTIVCKSVCLLLDSLTTHPNSHEQPKIWINTYVEVHGNLNLQCLYSDSPQISHPPNNVPYKQTKIWIKIFDVKSSMSIIGQSSDFTHTQQGTS